MIKKFFTVFMLTAAMFFGAATLNGAEKKVSAPEAAVRNFYAAMAKADIAAAKKYVDSKELAGMLTFLENMIKEDPETKADTVKEFSPMLKAKIETAEIKGNSAKVKVTYIEKGKTKTDTHTLKKSGGKWKITD